MSDFMWVMSFVSVVYHSSNVLYVLMTECFEAGGGVLP